MMVRGLQQLSGFTGSLSMDKSSVAAAFWRFMMVQGLQQLSGCTRSHLMDESSVAAAFCPLCRAN